jgi:hypothetical protein
VGRSRAYIPYEKDSNCDFGGASSQFPVALAIDGTGHDKGGEAAKHSVSPLSPALHCQQPASELIITNNTGKRRGHSEGGGMLHRRMLAEPWFATAACR